MRKKLQEMTRGNIPHSTLHGEVKGMEKAKCVKIIDRRPFRTKLDVKTYDITADGLNYLIRGGSMKLNVMKIDILVEFAVKKAHLHPFFGKIREWKLDQTPELTKLIIEHCLTGIETLNSLDYAIKRMTHMLIALVFRDKFSIYSEKEDWSIAFGYIEEYGKTTETARQEALFFLQNNVWMKEMMLEQIDNYIDHHKKEVNFLEEIRKLMQN